jgi:hypothetical protein
MDSSPNTNSISSNRYSMHRVCKRSHLYPSNLLAVYKPSESNYRYNVTKPPASIPKAGHEHRTAASLIFDLSKFSTAQAIYSFCRPPGDFVHTKAAGPSLSSARLETTAACSTLDDFNLIDSRWKAPATSQISWERISVLRKDVVAHCYRLLKVSQKGSPEVTADSIDPFDLSILKKCSSSLLVRMCLHSQEESMKVQCYLLTVPDKQLEVKASVFSNFAGRLLSHPNGNYIATWLVTKSPCFMKSCETYTLSNLELLVSNKCAVKVMQALAGVSKTFCKVFNQYFKHNYVRLCKSKQASIVMNAVVLNLDEEDDLQYLISDVARKLNQDRGEIRTEMLRVLSSLLQKCSLIRLSGVLAGLANKIWWLADDKIGNYSVQVLLTPKFQSLHPTVVKELLSEAPLTLLSSKFKQIVTLKSLDYPLQDYFHSHILQAIMKQTSSVHLALSTPQSAWLLLALLYLSSDNRVAAWAKLVLAALRNKQTLNDQTMEHLDLAFSCKVEELIRLQSWVIQHTCTADSSQL